MCNGLFHIITKSISAAICSSVRPTVLSWHVFSLRCHLIASVLLSTENITKCSLARPSSRNLIQRIVSTWYQLLDFMAVDASCSSTWVSASPCCACHTLTLLMWVWAFSSKLHFLKWVINPTGSVDWLDVGVDWRHLWFTLRKVGLALQHSVSVWHLGGRSVTVAPPSVFGSVGSEWGGAPFIETSSYPLPTEVWALMYFCFFTQLVNRSTLEKPGAHSTLVSPSLSKHS